MQNSGTENFTELGTKVLDVTHLCSIIVLGFANEAVGGDQGSQEEFVDWHNEHKKTRRPGISTVCGSDAVVRPDEARKAERACVNTTSDQNCWTWVSRSYKTDVFRTRASQRAFRPKC